MALSTEPALTGTAAREASTSPDPQRSPYAELALLRSRGPILEMFPDGRIDQPAAPVAGSTRPRKFRVLAWEAVSEILESPEVFSSRIFAPTLWVVMGTTIIHMDDPEHALYRDAFRALFSPPLLARWESEIIRPIAHQLVDQLVNRGHADLARELTQVLPLRVLNRILGLPESDDHIVHRWPSVLGGAPEWEAVAAVSRDITAYLTAALDEKRRRPADDLLSQLVAMKVRGRPLDDSTLLSFLRLLVPSGYETTFRALGNLLFGLLTHPAQLEALKANRDLLVPAIEEGLRWEIHDVRLTRYAMRDTVVCGVPIPAGSSMDLSLASANNDPRCFDRPEVFDIHRRSQPHLSFGAGPHYCIGAKLSRIEMRVAIETLLDRLPLLRIDPAWHDRHFHGGVFRAPENLLVVFGA